MNVFRYLKLSQNVRILALFFFSYLETFQTFTFYSIDNDKKMFLYTFFI